MAKRQPPATDDLFDTKRQRNTTTTTTTTTKVGILHLKSLDTPFISSTTNSPCYLFSLKSGRLYTIGRKHHLCNLVFDDPRVSKRHCQIFFDASHCKIFILDGFFLPFCSARTRFQSLHDIIPDGEEFKVRPSLNGVFVNGVRIRGNKFVQLCVGDEVHFVCSNELDQSFKLKIGFVVQKVIFNEEVVKCPVVDAKISKACFKRGKELAKGKVFYTSLDDDDKSSRLVFLLSQCRKILHSQDPISYAQWCLNIKELLRIENGCPVIVDPSLSDTIEIPSSTSLPDDAQNTAGVEATSNAPKSNKVEVTRKIHLSSEGKAVLASAFIPNDTLQQNNYGGTSVQNAPGNPIEKVYESDSGQCSKKDLEILCSSPGKKFYLNRLDCKDGRLFDQHMVVSLPELLHPVESLSRMFIATFTSDIRWFLSYCKVSNYLPVTIACHNSERCWSSSPDKRIMTPYEDFPNLMVVYPPFPEVIAFGQDRKRQGIACHHPKLLVLQREDSIRVVVTSANLVSKQWNDVTNTVWWQDFPLRALPDYSSLFTCANEETSEGFRSDFAAQLAGFMASLLVDVPSQAYWITELTKYEFGGAHGHLVASVPGMHRNRTPYPLESMYFLSGNNCASRLPGMKFLGSVEASLVGLKHRFHTAADSNGATLKTLAAFLRKCRVNAFGMSEVVLRRIHNIPADANAVSVLIFDLDEFSEGDYVQLGFLPRNIAKWVASLCDAGFFSFSAYIYPKEVLAAALEGTNNKVQLMLYVSQGPCFSEISSMLQPEHVASISSLVASLQRCVGLSRLQEVLGRYKWPELLETDFIYGSSSIGTSINSKFLAAFSSAAGKRSIQFSESEESDPEWGRWSATEELKKPSMRILYPTIGRVRDASCGIWPFRRLLCLSEGTWQRLKEAHIFHDAIPRPSCRVGYPMHVKENLVEAGSKKTLRIKDRCIIFWMGVLWVT